MDTIRVLRIIQYEGPRDKVEKQVANSLHGGPKDYGNGVQISVATIGEFPQVLTDNIVEAPSRWERFWRAIFGARFVPYGRD